MPENVHGPAFLDISALAVCLIGFIGLISLFLEIKAGVQGVPRILYLVLLAMICAPFYVALVRTPKLPFLIPPIVAIFLLFPIAAPHGIIWGTDPIFNMAFSDRIVQTGFWAPGAGNAFSYVYSFYPLGNVFVGYIILNTGQPAVVAYMWIEPILRILALPAALFALGRRLFSTRIAVLGLFFYLGTASILFNNPVQQGFGIVFVCLSLLSLVMLSRSADKSSQRRIQVLFALVSGGIVMTHHLSSYIFAGWLATLALLMARPRFRPVVGSLRLGVLFVYFIAILGLYIAFFTLTIFVGHEQNLEAVVGRFISPESVPAGPSVPLGRTFAPEEIAWLGASVLMLLILALISVVRYRASRDHPFAVANGLVATTIAVVTLPLIVTGFNFVTLRIGEYTNLFVGPFAAATLIRWSGGASARWPRLMTRFTRDRSWLPRAACLLLAAAIFMGGNLAPSLTRMYFELPPPNRNTESPLHFGADVQRIAKWADVHVGRSRVWGDSLAVNTFGGLADMRIDYGGERLFVATAFNETLWRLLRVGDYVALDRWMLTERPNFFLEPPLGGPLTQEQFGKFDRDPHFALVYRDASFSLYRVMSKPP